MYVCSQIRALQCREVLYFRRFYSRCPFHTNIPLGNLSTLQSTRSRHADTMIHCIAHTQTPITPSSTITTQFIEFTYCHDIFSEQTLAHKHINYDPLMNIIENNGWKTNPLITITIGVRGAMIHKHSINKLTNLKITKQAIKTLMQNIHQNAITYLTYVILNKRKLENKQTPVPPP